MTARHSHGPSRLVAALMASLLAIFGLAFMPGVAGATHGGDHVDFTRLAGEDRFETAVEISQATFTTSTDALIARADLFPDALSGNYLAGQLGAPILLSYTDDVPQVTLTELERLGVDTVHLLGETAALDASVAAELEAEGYTVMRHGGADRFETAAEIADAGTNIGGHAGYNQVALIANGLNFPDALAGGPLAYARDFPLLLVTPDQVPQVTEDALQSLGIDAVIILGGPAAVGDEVEGHINGLGVETLIRLAGSDRYGTARRIAEYAIQGIGDDPGLGFTRQHVNIAVGTNFPDALTGGPHAGEEESVILLTEPNSVPVPTCDALEDFFQGPQTTGHIFGGTAAVDVATEEELEACAEAGVAPLNVTANPTTVERGGDTTLTLSGDFATAEIAGACLQGSPMTVDPADDEDTTANGVQVTVSTRADATEGDCVITVTFFDADGSEIGEDSVTITITAPQQGEAAALDLQPETDINAAATQHAVVADVDDAEGDPVADGTLVRFEVFRDFNQGAGESGEFYFVTGGFDTVTGGTADFAYTGPAENEQDAIVACVVQNNTQSCTSGTTLMFSTTGQPTNVTADVFDLARKEWTQRAAAALNAEPETDVNASGDEHTVTATLTDQFGDPVRGAIVGFEVFYDSDFDGNYIFQDYQETITGGTTNLENDPNTPDTRNAPGVATFTFSDADYSGPGRYLVAVCTDADDDDTCAVITATTRAGTQEGTPTRDPQEPANLYDEVLKEFVAVQAATAATGNTTGAVTDTNEGTPDDNQGSFTAFTAEQRHLEYFYEIEVTGADTFFVDGFQVTEEDCWEAALSEGDTITVENYSVQTGNQATFRLTDADNSGAGCETL